MLAAMSRSFADATSRRGAVLFVDELDAIGDRARMRTDHTYYEGNVIGRFLDLTTIIVGATNYGYLIDNAILRSGRLENHVYLNLRMRSVRKFSPIISITLSLQMNFAKSPTN